MKKGEGEGRGGGEEGQEGWGELKEWEPRAGFWVFDDIGGEEKGGGVDGEEEGGEEANEEETVDESSSSRNSTLPGSSTTPEEVNTSMSDGRGRWVKRERGRERRRRVGKRERRRGEEEEVGEGDMVVEDGMMRKEQEQGTVGTAKRKRSSAG